MDQTPLVADQIATGRRLVDAVAARANLSVAFWTRTPADWGWMLYLASPDVSGRDPRTFIALVTDCLEAIHDESPETVGPLDHDRVVMLSSDSPTARTVIRASAGAARRSPAADIRLPGDRLPELEAPEVYVYALPAPTPA